MNISILGTGKMGAAVGRRLAHTGHNVVYGSRDPLSNRAKFIDHANIVVTTYQDACQRGEVIIVAVPWAHVLALLRIYKRDLENKVVIDLTNPLSPDISHLVVSSTSSAAELISAAIEGAQVVKAFNGITADNFATPEFSGAPAQVFFCSDSPKAKEVAQKLIVACGYRPQDCGVLSNARYIEAIAMLWLQLAFWEDKGSDFSFQIVQKSSLTS